MKKIDLKYTMITYLMRFCRFFNKSYLPKATDIHYITLLTQKYTLLGIIHENILSASSKGLSSVDLWCDKYEVEVINEIKDLLSKKGYGVTIKISTIQKHPSFVIKWDTANMSELYRTVHNS